MANNIEAAFSLAVAEALMEADISESDERIRERIIDSIHLWGRKYPDAGYGSNFAMWLYLKDRKPYNSFGNGSAMRVSSAAWVADNLEDVRRLDRLSAEVTHDHAEGIKGAEATASVIFLSRAKWTKDDIKKYVRNAFGYDLSRTCDEIRPTYHHVESCQQTVPEAITAFLEGNNFEDVIRTAVSLGGDCDTLAAIAGSMAEGMYGVPAELKKECYLRVDSDIERVLKRFDADIMQSAQVRF